MLIRNHCRSCGSEAGQTICCYRHDHDQGGAWFIFTHCFLCDFWEFCGSTPDPDLPPFEFF